jgi:hypothetical protein
MQDGVHVPGRATAGGFVAAARASRATFCGRRRQLCKSTLPVEECRLMLAAAVRAVVAPVHAGHA